MIRGEMIEALTSAAYEAGAPPIAVAELVVKILIGESGQPCDRCQRLLARRILAALMDANWRPPEGTVPCADLS